jgi:hypothetical protein
VVPLIHLLPSRTISPAMGIFIPYVSDLKHLINLIYLRTKCKISIMLRLKLCARIKKENITEGIFLMGKFPDHLPNFLKKMT